MANIIDYVQWRGDIPFRQVPVGEVDALILSYLSYMRFEGIVGEAFRVEGVPLAKAAEKLLERPDRERASMNFSVKDDETLLKLLTKSERFGQARLVGFINRIDTEKERQFGAVTYLLDDGTAFVSYRGTDQTVVGWKENFNMSFDDAVPAQRDAVAYAEYAAEAIGRPMIIGGHSKGGNLAAYAGIFMNDQTRSLVLDIYNFDGPGFNETTCALPEFQNAQVHVHTFVPQSSRVGILLWHREPFTVVKSDSVSVFQHNMYSWQLMAGRFTTLPGLTSNSHFADETLKRWLEELTPERRRMVIDGIYSVLSASDGGELMDLFEMKNVMAIIKAAGAMDEETKGAVIEAFRLLGQSFMEGVPGWIDRTASDIRLHVMGERRDAEKKSDLTKA